MSQAERHQRIDQSADLALYEIRVEAKNAGMKLNRSFGQLIRQHERRIALLLSDDNLGDA